MGAGVRCVAAAVLVICADVCLAQARPTSEDWIWIEPTTPMDEAIRRGILLSPLEEGAVAPASARNPLFNRLRRLPSAIAADNGGDRFLGETRVGAGLNLENPLGLGDRLSVAGLSDVGNS